MAEFADRATWDVWFDAQFRLSRKLDDLFADATRDKSPAFKAATAAAMVEHFAESMRFHLELPASDVQPVEALPGEEG